MDSPDEVADARRDALLEGGISADPPKRSRHRIVRRALVTGVAGAGLGLLGYRLLRLRRDDQPRSDPRVLWRRDLARSPAGAEFVVANGSIYLSTSTGLQALDAATGQVRWQVASRAGDSWSPAVADGAVYFGDGNVSLAVDAADGRVRWRTDASQHPFLLKWSSPAVADGFVYWSTYAGGLSGASPFSQRYMSEIKGCVVTAWAVGSGELRWLARIDSALLSPVAVAAGMVYAAGNDGTLHAIDAQTGRALWQRSTGAGVDARPAVAAGSVYVNDKDGTLNALDAATGAPRWSAPIRPAATRAPTSPAPTEPSPVVIAGGLVYLGGVDGYLHVLDAATGEPRWKAPEAAAGGSPAVANGCVYFAGSDRKVYAVDALTGARRWTVETEASGGSLVATNDAVYHLSEYRLSALRV
ncbi:PQQ-binding-like beta-propeller repeat protein [Dactylosporangium sp. AC04546]|uniref:outer membrane protein assembly factor BamB family protein n=1 Tax=Dactylosporangium sp. AC04546 TaxID=2862460 RepID=UPI001EE04042|nr:PQQ-binding-like beta-propeller repeat protein [Dactylosporangium sp. AC04546]WVK86898.1 PQQ-binding-like beta-propeller repeat protein [Dactylosporangium sp. AC04546]